MNNVDGICVCCGHDTPYTGNLPIICPSCQKIRADLSRAGVPQLGLVTSNNMSPRLFLPDSMLMPRPCRLTG